MPDPAGGDDPKDPADLPRRPRRKQFDRVPRDLEDIMREYRRNPALMAREIQDLREKLDTHQVPDGSVVVKADRVKLLEQYEALGKPDDLKAAVEKVPGLERTIAERSARDTRETAFDATAAVFGWNRAAAKKAAAQLPLTVEMRDDDVEVTTNGKTEKVKKSVAFVLTGEGSTAKAERLDVVLKRDHELLMPALTTTDTTAPERGTDTARSRETLPPAPRETGARQTANTQDAGRAARRRVVSAL